MSRLKMAVIGVGALGRHHARILSELEGVELAAVSDIHAEAGRRVAEACRTEFATDYRELLGRVDAVSIAVPTSEHLPVAADFLSRGIPVLVEKPLADDVPQAEQLVHLAEKHGTLLQVGHIERFNPATVTAWSLCGPPKYIRAERVSPYSFRSTDIGVVHDLMIHDLDLLLDLARAPVRHVEAFGVCLLGGHEDSVQARICFEDGCIADLTASRVCPAAGRSMQIWSHQGCVTVDFTSREVVRYSPSDSLLFGTPPVERARQPDADVERLKKEVFGTFLEIARPPVSQADALTAELSSFVDCVLHEKRPIVDGHQALQAMKLAQRVLDCVAAHQWDGHAHGAVGPHARVPGRRKLAA